MTNPADEASRVVPVEYLYMRQMDSWPDFLFKNKRLPFDTVNSVSISSHNPEVRGEATVNADAPDATARMYRMQQIS